MEVSPITYAHQFRIEKAKEMLGSDYGTLSDMAQSFWDIPGFTFYQEISKSIRDLRLQNIKEDKLNPSFERLSRIWGILAIIDRPPLAKRFL